MPDLFDPLRIKSWDLPHRLVMAPLTRSRATEGTQPSAVGQGYLNTPGIHTPEQIAGWRRVADAVHARGGRIVVQLMHAGRISHADNKDGLETVAPSAIAAPNEMFTADGMKPFPVPRELATDEIPGIVEEFVHAARSAVEAGLDGVEVHAANGYLLHQFLAPGSNERSDEYGGSPANRARLAVEVTRAIADAIGPDRVGIRISPAHNVQGATETDPADVEATYAALVDGIAPLGIAYLSVLADPSLDLVQRLRKDFGGVLIANDGFGQVTTRESAQALLDDDLADAVAVGRLYIANPDLPQRWQSGADLNEPDPDTFYGGGAKGYTDYPSLAS